PTGSLRRASRGSILAVTTARRLSPISTGPVEDDAVVFSFNDLKSVVHTPLRRTLLDDANPVSPCIRCATCDGSARIALARSFLGDAPAMVLDEPTAHLDPANAAAIVSDVLTSAVPSEPAGGILEDAHVTPSDPSTTALAPLLQAFSPMALTIREPSAPVVGRQGEQEAIRQELASAKAGRLVGITLEGEPGIGKTRLLLAAASMGSAEGFTTIAVTAAEELRG